MTLGRRFVRVATNAATRAPWLWPLLRPALRSTFDGLAPVWDTLSGPDTLAPLRAGVERAAADGPPRRILDVGTGTGNAALVLAERFPEAEVVGVDLSERMLERARAKGGRVEWVLGDGNGLPFADGSFDLVALANMVPFPPELGRVTAPGGRLVVAFSAGPSTPIWVPLDRLRADLARHGFDAFEEVAAARGVALVARRREMP